MSSQIYDDYVMLFRKIADLKYASAVLQWDQETYLPINGNDHRGHQIATLTEMAHQLFIDEKTGSLLTCLSESNQLSPHQLKNVQLSLEDYNRNKKIPSDFVRTMTEATHQSFHAWIAARRQNDFCLFKAPLQKIIELKRQEADLLGYEHHPYDALMNDYDKGLNVSETDHLFESLKQSLKPMLDTIRQAAQPDNEFLHRSYPKEKQWQLGIDLLKSMEFDFNSGRQDISEHPFTTNFSSRDVRLTTRIDENDLANMVWSCIHEGGHGLYEQGLPDHEYGLPGGEYCSLSIHESQSRLWENCIGRGKSFWKHHYQKVQQFFPESLADVDLDQFYKGINKVQPSLIRTEADELTYHFHVIIRYELEKMLMEGTLNAKDIPAYWNEQYLKYLGTHVPDDLQGCLQDVHWSHGSFGYFATYSIGSLYAAQLWSHIKKEQPDLENKMSSGDTSPVLSWLKNKIYPFGKHLNSSELCKSATGSKLDSTYFIDYAQQKFSDIYGVIF
jgi:carboxypeptidase Taq